MVGAISTAIGLAFGTLVSEDLTCIAAGLLVARGDMTVATGVAGCCAGILAGDIGLWGVGRVFGGAALHWKWLQGSVGDRRVGQLRDWLDHHAGIAIVGSRFVPGSRLPLYILAGVLSMPSARFVGWATLATILWTPPLVLLAATLGETVALRLPFLFGAAATVAIAARWLASAPARTRLAARLARWRRWEFWPMWLFYAPVALYVTRLAWRHGGLVTITAANPGIPDGGIVGESKTAILARLPADATIPFALIARGDVNSRVNLFRQVLSNNGWIFPLVLKPDVGQRGAGVKLVKTPDEAETYLRLQAGPVIVQPYHPGPFEAGVFYYRVPGASRGHIFSITDKHFPSIVGDGESTIEDLIWRHPRYRMQAGMFVRRHRAMLSHVLEAGQRFQLGIAGNHAQGALFRDGRRLITPQLENRIDEIARAYPGFFVGRFDIRYSDEAAFKAGIDIAIVELNGSTAESTDIYDPERSLLEAYRRLFRQWTIVFKIGAANRSGGAPVSSRRRLLDMLRAHLTSRTALAVSD
jgi:membrane protein DedA with SNARE-associated domain